MTKNIATQNKAKLYTAKANFVTKKRKKVRLPENDMTKQKKVKQQIGEAMMGFSIAPAEQE